MSSQLSYCVGGKMGDPYYLQQNAAHLQEMNTLNIVSQLPLPTALSRPTRSGMGCSGAAAPRAGVTVSGAGTGLCVRTCSQSAQQGWHASRRPSRLQAKKAGSPAPPPGEEAAMIELELMDKMEKAVDAMRRNIGTVRTGRANASMLDRIQVDYYGAMTPLKSMANVSTPDAQSITIQPFDKTAIKEIERAINQSDLGINPSNDGNIIRLVVPMLTEDRRKEMTKMVGKLAEDGKIAVRNVRRDGLKQLEKLQKDGALSEDELAGYERSVQKLTDGFVKEMEQLEAQKSKELMQV